MNIPRWQLTLNDAQLDRLSEASANIAVVALAALIFPSFGERNLELMIKGLAVTAGFLAYSLWLIRTKSIPSPPSIY
jgi:hypothetical protein